MIDLKTFEVWFITGSQNLYGEETLRQVAEHSQTYSRGLKQRGANACTRGTNPW
jgi:L-arabinose isomerase